MRAWLVNTNTKHDNENPNGFKYMLRHNKAIAFFDRGVQMAAIQSGDIAMLYHNQNRIVAVGCVVNPPQQHDYEDAADVETWVDVNWLWKADFDQHFAPLNPINRHDVGLGVLAGIELARTVVEVTNWLDYKSLIAEIAHPSRQKFL